MYRKIIKIVLIEFFLLFSNFITIQQISAQQWANITNSDNITSIAIAPNGDLWIGVRGGVVSYKKNSGILRKFTVADGLILNDISSVAISPNGDVWAGGYWGWGLSKYDGVRWVKFPIPYSPYLPNPPLNGSNIKDMKFDSSGTLWICAYGEFKFAKIQNNIFSVLGGGFQPSSIAVGKNKEIWMGTYSEGLVKYKASVFTYYNLSQFIYDIDVDNNGNVWCATSNGIKIFNGSNWDSLTTINSNIPYNNVSKLKFDKNGNLWALFYSELTKSQILGKYNGNIWQIFDSNNSPLTNQTIITCMAFDNDGVAYFGTKPYLELSTGILFEGGGYIYKYYSGSWDSIKITTSSLPYPPVTTITVDNFGNLWVGTLFNGITKFDGHNWIHYNTSKNPFYPSNNIGILSVSNNGEVWAKGYGFSVSGGYTGGYFPGGLVHFDGTSWVVYLEKDSLTGNLSVKDISTIFCDNNSVVYFGTSNKGIYKYDGNNWFHLDSNLIGVNSIHKIKKDNSNNIWIFGDKKVIKFDGYSFHTVINEIPFSEIKGMDITNEGMVCLVTQIPNHAYLQIQIYENGNWLTIEGPTMPGGIYVRSFAIDNNDILWIGLYGGGVISYDGSFNSYNGKNSGLGYEFITYIYVDQHNTKYFAGQDYGGGISLFNESGLSFVEQKYVSNFTKYELYQNYPNPFNSTTNISFYLPEKCIVNLKIYNSLGELIYTLVNKELESGNHVIHFNADNLSSGIYFYTLETGKLTLTKKLVILK